MDPRLAAGGQLKTQAERSLATNSFLWWLIVAMVVLALAASVALLLSDTTAVRLGLSSTVISAAPLLLIGLSFLLFQPTIQARGAELIKNLLLAVTFLLWGIVQLMPQGALSGRLGNLVIVLYVSDLAWVILATLSAKRRKSS